ncbi:MAG: hypothetical protein IT381_25170 [Deltaproteobacteria bacterium]|nr:hypothetical protein [Deltaproteobacteria bacterium]
MTAHRDLKKLIRERQTKTGEAYTIARMHVLRAQAELLGTPADEPPTTRKLEAIVLKLNRQSARLRLLGDTKDEVTFRSSDIYGLAPGQVVSIEVEHTWSFRGHSYASGKVTSSRIDIAKLGLAPLPFTGGHVVDLREVYEPVEGESPYAMLWRMSTETPRETFEFDPIAWGAFPDADLEDNPTCNAAELIEEGNTAEAYPLLMDALHRDLRCIDAHALLGNLAFKQLHKQAMVHFEIGMRIAELSIPADFRGAILWGPIYNRPYLRCLHGYALCLWRLGRLADAQRLFERILWLNPTDNQGARFNWDDVRSARSWEEVEDSDHPRALH